MNTYGLSPENLPKHIAIIMDGNGRWAKKRNLPRTAGHYKGADRVKKISRYCYDIGIKVLTLYAFSTENWARPKEEVEALFVLFYEQLKDYKSLMGNRRMVIRFLGDRSVLSPELRRRMAEIEIYSDRFKDDGYTFNFAINYGGREEIVKAVKEIAVLAQKGKISAEDIDAQMVNDHLYTAGLPDPDLLIRPSGELRLSNFLLWQSAYTEFYNSDVLWPDFSNKKLVEAIKEYQKRSRRFGGV